MVFRNTLTEEDLNEVQALWERHDKSIRKAARAANLPESTFKHRLYTKWYGPFWRQDRKIRNAKKKPVARRHFIVPDTQVRPGVPLDHLGWVRQAIEEYRPQVLIHIGDHWDMPSLNSHEEPGSEFMEGQRYHQDVEVGNEAFKTLFEGLKVKPERKLFCFGNHEERADRFAAINPKFRHLVSTQDCNTLDFERHKFGKIVEIDGVLYSHYFSNPHSGRAIGGTIQNKLTKVGRSFVQGHVQGRDYGSKLLATGETISGEVVGSCYLHQEAYRGAHQRHWRGVLILNEVEDGDWQEMPLSLKYLCKKYTGEELFEYMKKRYPDENWEHLV